MIPRHGVFIGKQLEVIGSGNEQLIGIKGKIVDETKNTFIVETEDGEKTLLKEQSTFAIDDQQIQGKDILGKPEDRIKK